MESVMKDQLLKSIDKLLVSEKFTDITLLVDGNKLQAHKNILASRNEVLEAMLTNDMVEKNKNVIDIPDVDIATFKAFLKYVYTGIVEDENLTLELLILADKFLDQTLKDSCEIFLCQDISFDDAIDKLLVANRHNCHDLETRSASYIASHINDFLESPKFEKVLECKDIIKSIFKESKALFIALQEEMSTFVFPFNVANIFSGSVYSSSKLDFIVKNVQWSTYVQRVTTNGTESMACVLSTNCDHPVNVNLRIKLISKKKGVDAIEIVRDNFIFDQANNSSNFNLIAYPVPSQADNKQAFCPGNILSVKVSLNVLNE